MTSNHEDPPDMEPGKQFSIHVSRALDCLGKSQGMIHCRAETYKQNQQIVNYSRERDLEYIIAGSKSEGLTAPYESDYDYMHVSNDIICVEDTSISRQITGFHVFETDRREVSPGYTKLRLVRLQGLSHRYVIQKSLIQDKNGQSYLSGDLYFDSVELLGHRLFRDCPIQHLDRSGPSQPYIVGPSQFSEDHVLAIQCICPQISHSFFTRNRDYGWPINDHLVEISSLEGHVVPVGYKGSDNAFVEWRICYTEAERLLMRSLNDTQTKLYILLKMVAKTYINSTSADITSYVLKNIVLWLAECCDVEIFKEELLIDRLNQALCFLRQCIINNNLPSYMIPERNLFSGKLELVQRQKLTILLADLIRKRGGILMGCERLCGTMIVLYKQPAEAEQYKLKGDMIEKLYIWMNNKLEIIMASCKTQQDMILVCSGDKDYQNAFSTYYHLIIPDRLSLLQHGRQSFISIVAQRIKQWLS